MAQPCIAPGRGITSPPMWPRVSTSLQLGATNGQRRRFATKARRQPTTIPARTTLEAWLAATPMAVDLDTWAKAAEEGFQARHTFGGQLCTMIRQGLNYRVSAEL